MGEPESRAARRIGDLDCEAWLWPVPLWHPVIWLRRT
ncbi:hypothetical protein SVIOM74S_08434 [Streptomyces violarus]